MISVHECPPGRDSILGVRLRLYKVVDGISFSKARTIRAYGTVTYVLKTVVVCSSYADSAGDRTQLTPSGRDVKTRYKDSPRGSLPDVGLKSLSYGRGGCRGRNLVDSKQTLYRGIWLLYEKGASMQVRSCSGSRFLPTSSFVLTRCESGALRSKSKKRRRRVQSASPFFVERKWQC